MWVYIGVTVALLMVVLSEPNWADIRSRWSLEKVYKSDPHQDKNWAWHYIGAPEFTEPLEKFQQTLPREHEIKCWTCYTLDTLEVSTNNCNRTLCTGQHISACYKWHVIYGFKKYRTYRGCMENYTEIDYENAMCRGTGLPLNETCEWSLCKTDYCNSSLLTKTSFLLIFALMVYWNLPPMEQTWRQRF